MIYLDSAATTLQKPPAVSRAMSDALSHMASPGRGGYEAAMRAGETTFACRETAAELFDVENPENVVLTFNATHGLNIAIKSRVKPGDTVLISGYEHNAVVRPLYALGAKIKIASAPLFDSVALLRAFEEQMTEEVSCVICNHVSNVFGYILPLEQIAVLCRRKGVPLIVDASQSAGCIPVRQRALGADFVAMPGHKGLYGPQGTGLLLCGGDSRTLLEGGTGSMSARREMPEFLPDRLEAGTHNIPGAAGLLEGMRYIKKRGMNNILEHERTLTVRTVRRLEQISGVRVFRSPDPARQLGVFSFLVDGMDCEQTGELLGERGFALRAGLHCAPLAHQSAGTFQTGTIRASFSAFNTTKEADALVRMVEHICAKR